MSKYSNRNSQYNNNQAEDKDTQEADEAPVVSNPMIDQSLTTDVVVPAPVPSPAPSVPVYIAAPTPAPQPEAIVTTSTSKMLPIQSELVAFSQALSLKKPVEGRWQYNLLQLIRNAIENPDQEVFQKNWIAILAFFHRSKGTLFSDSHILRPSEEWPGSEADFSLFRRLIHVITQTADPVTRRKETVRIDLGRATSGLSADASNRLIGFYD